MTEPDFIQLVNDEITVSGMLPNIVPTREIQRIIKKAANWFYDNYYNAVEIQRYVIKHQHCTTPEYKRNRTFKMPDCVITVTEFTEINGAGTLGNIDKDFSENRLIASEIFLSSYNGDDLTMRVAAYSYYDLAKAFFLEQIAHQWNKNTKQLKVLGRDPLYDVMALCWIAIPMDRLFDDVYFQDYCIGQAKISFARLVGTYPFPLPGGVEIQSGDMKSEGEAQIEKVLEEIKTEDTVDWFLQYH